MIFKDMINFEFFLNLTTHENNFLAATESCANVAARLSYQTSKSKVFGSFPVQRNFAGGTKI